MEVFHQKRLIHRDIKPDNFLISRPGIGSPKKIFLVDPGMAKYYRDPKTEKHIPYRERKSLAGTARYMSINTHLGREQSRRDDLEALFHVFIYFLKGGLPWQGLAAPTKKKHERIGEKKQTTAIKDLCENCPDELGECLQYTRDLKFDQDPDYDYLRGLLTQALENSGEIEDGEYDWDKGGAEPEPASSFSSSQILNDSRSIERRELLQAGRKSDNGPASQHGREELQLGSGLSREEREEGAQKRQIVTHIKKWPREETVSAGTDGKGKKQEEEPL